jgi:hypothetical protein
VTEAATTLDTEPALRSRAVIAGRQVTYVTSFHDRRPVIAYWSEPVALANEERVEAMRAGFRFVDAPPTASATPFVDPTELVPFISREDGYELLIPRFWGDGRTTADPGIRRFGFGGGSGTRGDPALTISIGEPNGTVIVCQNLAGCNKVTATTLDELGAALISVPKEMRSAIYGPVEGSCCHLVLGGEAGRTDRPTYKRGGGQGCLGCPGMLYFQYAFHRGRPVVLAWDFWTIHFKRFSSSYIDEITASFRFLD